MSQVFDKRSILGALIWLALIALLILVGRSVIDSSPDSVKELTDYVGRQRRFIQLESNYNLAVRVGDPVFLEGSDEVTPIGSVSKIEMAQNGFYAKSVEVCMFGSSPPISPKDHFEFHYAPDSTEWLVRTMLTDAKKEQIRTLLQDAFEYHRDDIIAAFRPVVEQSLVQAKDQIAQDLKEAIANREDQLSRIGDRYQQELIKQKFVPLFQDEIWPLVQEESQPLMTEISREIWREVSVFSFGWRYIYDRSPLPEKNLTEKKFNLFVEQKAKPIIESHTDDFVELQKELTRQILANDKFQKTVNNSITTIAKDSEIQQLMTDVFREVFIDNKPLHDAIKEQWASPEAQKAIRLANSKLDPTIREIGVIMFGTPKEGITPEFAKVLRRRILHKDTSWFTLHLADADVSRAKDRNAPFPESLPVKLSDEDTNIPTAVK